MSGSHSILHNLEKQSLQKLGEVKTVKNARQEAADIRLAGMKAAAEVS